MTLFVLGIIAVGWAGGTACGWCLRGYAERLDEDDRHCVRGYKHERDALARINRIQRPGA